MDTGKEDTSFRSPTVLFFQIIGKHLEREQLKGEKVCFFFLTVQRDAVHHGEEGMGRKMGQLLTLDLVLGVKE